MAGVTAVWRQSSATDGSGEAKPYFTLIKQHSAELRKSGIRYRLNCFNVSIIFEKWKAFGMEIKWFCVFSSQDIQRCVMPIDKVPQQNAVSVK